MGKEKKKGQGASRPGTHAKEKFRKTARAVDWSKVAIPTGLQARPEMPSIRSKHQSYYEIVENKDKKKKLEFKVKTPFGAPSPEARLTSSLLAGNPQQRTTTWLRVRPCRPSRVNFGMQGTVTRTGCSDIHCYGRPRLRFSSERHTNST